jgi:hypothetical protein
MVKIMQTTTRKIGRTRTNLMERRRPPDPCHTFPAASAMTADSNSCRSEVTSLATVVVVVVVVEVVRMPEQERRDLFEFVKQRQPPLDWLRFRFNVGLLSRSCSAKHFW